MSLLLGLPTADYCDKHMLSEAHTNSALCALLAPLKLFTGADFWFIVRDCESGLDHKCKFSSLLDYLEESMGRVNDVRSEVRSEVIPEVTIKECLGSRGVITTIKGNVDDIKKLMEHLDE
jgi:hypothetical protein